MRPGRSTRWPTRLIRRRQPEKDAIAVLDRFPWARPTETVSSVIVTTPVEVPILPAAR
jgi:hypothetical protein